LVSALIETGAYQDAQKILYNYNPKNGLYLLSIFLGCYLSSEIRMISASDKKITKEICDYLAPKIKTDRVRLGEEFKSELLEIRKARIAELEHDLEHDVAAGNNNADDELEI
jgi:hypothetical protein